MVKRTSINENMKCVTINVFAKSGIIAQIAGVQQIESMEDCTKSLLYGRIGQQCDDSKAILDKIYVFAFSSESAIKLKENVDKAYDLLKISDANGNDMIYDRIDTEKIISWWE